LITHSKPILINEDFKEVILIELVGNEVRHLKSALEDIMAAKMHPIKV
jgi:hypothetical protein